MRFVFAWFFLYYIKHFTYCIVQLVDGDWSGDLHARQAAHARRVTRAPRIVRPAAVAEARLKLVFLGSYGSPRVHERAKKVSPLVAVTKELGWRKHGVRLGVLHKTRRIELPRLRRFFHPGIVTAGCRGRFRPARPA